jgi:hypothetical protein
MSRKVAFFRLPGRSGDSGPANADLHIYASSWRGRIRSRIDAERYRVEARAQRDLLAAQVDANEKVLPQLRADFQGITWSFEGTQAEMRESIQALWGGFARAMLVIISRWRP